MRHFTTIAAAALLTATVACGDDGSSSGGDTGADTGTDAPTAEIPYETLSEYGFFEGDGSTQEPVDGVVPFDVNVVLFSDQSSKFRFFWLPEGTTIEFDEDDNWVFPVGAVIIKTFLYYEDIRDESLGYTLMETRLLIHEETGWTAHTYVWDDEQNEAFRRIVGATIPITWIDRDGDEQALDYRVPNTNACGRCHGDPEPLTLGPHTRQLNRDNLYGDEVLNQIDFMTSIGWFSEDPPPSDELEAFPWIDDDTATVEARARGYLDVNCAHCHNDEDAASSTGLWLTWEEDDPSALGVCRVPFSAGAGTGGRLWDIVPGRPDESVMVYRMEATDPDIKMPELPSQLADEDGVAIIRAWIEGMPYVDCSAR